MNYTIGDSVFNDWIITRELGEGATGRVYEIEKNDHTISAKAALKVIRIPKSMSDVHEVMSEGMDEVSVTQYFREFVDEILREIKIMISLKDHPNIVGYEDHCVMEHEVEVGWDILIKMELLTPLSKWLLNHPMDEPTALRLGCEISSALAYATDSGLVHRDVKPENIFVDQMGRFKLGDFGIARTIEKTTGGLSKKGTESYMAPEVYLGKTYNDQIDIYSLGIVLYRLMNNNRLPFYPPVDQKISFSDRETALMKRMQGTPLPAPANGSREFQAVILKACEYLPENRYESMHELYNVLQKLGRTTREIPEMPVNQEMQENGSQETGQRAFSGGSVTRERKVADRNTTAEKKSTQRISNATEKRIGKDKVSDAEKSAPSGTGKKKKLILVAGLILALGIGGFAVHYGIENSKTYEVTVENGTEKGDNGGIYHKGNQVTVVADAPDEEDVEFSRWLTDGIELSEEDQKSAELTFSMPKENVSLKAQYKLKTEVTTITGGDVSGLNYYELDDDEIPSGDVTLTKLGNYTFDEELTAVVPYTENLFVGIYEENEERRYGLLDGNGRHITEMEYSAMHVEEGWICAKKADSSLWGVLSMNGEIVVPFEYDSIDIYDQKGWIIGVSHGNTKNNEDGNIFTFYHIADNICTSAVFLEDEIRGGWEENYLLVQKNGNYILCDTNFNIIDTIATEELSDVLSYTISDSERDYTKYTFTENAQRFLSKCDSLKWWKTLMENGYCPGSIEALRASGKYVAVGTATGDANLWGVADKEGNVIVPIEYDNIFTWNDAYFIIIKDGKFGWIGRDGKIMMEPDTYLYTSYGENNEEGLCLMGELAFCYREADGTFTLIACDGQITTGFAEEPEYIINDYGDLWYVEKEGKHCMIDWHGNVVRESERIEDLWGKTSPDSKFMLNPLGDGNYEMYKIERSM